MKKQNLFSISILAFLLLSNFAFLQSDVKKSQAEINSAFQSGNITKLAIYLNNPVDLTLPSADNNYSKAQAEVILKKFFTDNKVKSFQEKHSGKSVDGSLFIIGIYSSTNGKSFRTYVLIKTIANKDLIQLIEFEKE
ncbi:MAG: hypothetical protein AUJ98_01890 [Bacteroidetes bacterium CG2_30_33_31]|nr:MAG: hypothetical protein AUJ98_01890 [Bacteroidetes bacterium CG2_30_33_31]